MDDELSLPRDAEHLVDADPDPHRDARDRHPQRRSASRCSATTSRRSSASRSRSRGWSPAIPGTRSAFADRATGGFYLDVEVDREAAARYGLRVADVNDVVATAIGGVSVSTRRSRGASAIRSPSATRATSATTRDWLERVLVAAPSGAQVPLRQVAGIEFAHRTADDPQRGRPAGRLRLRRPRRAPDRRLRRGGAPGRGRPGGAAGRRAHRLGRPVPALRARQGAAQAGGAGDPAPDRAAALPEHPLGAPRSGSCSSRCRSR